MLLPAPPECTPRVRRRRSCRRPRRGARPARLELARELGRHGGHGGRQVGVAAGGLLRRRPRRAAGEEKEGARVRAGAEGLRARRQEFEAAGRGRSGAGQPFGDRRVSARRRRRRVGALRRLCPAALGVGGRSGGARRTPLLVGAALQGADGRERGGHPARRVEVVQRGLDRRPRPLRPRGACLIPGGARRGGGGGGGGGGGPRERREGLRGALAEVARRQPPARRAEYLSPARRVDVRAPRRHAGAESPAPGDLGGPPPRVSLTFI